MYINEIRVREDHRHKGFGQALLTRVEERAKEMGISSIYLHAEANNQDALHLYRSCGYQEERIQLRKTIETI